MKEEFKLFLSSFCEASTLPPAKHLSTFSVVGETSPSRLATPHHLAIGRWQPKISGKGWRDLAIHPTIQVKFRLSNVFGSQFSVEKSSKSLSAEIQQFCFIEMVFQLMKAWSVGFESICSAIRKVHCYSPFILSAMFVRFSWYFLRNGLTCPLHDN